MAKAQDVLPVNVIKRIDAICDRFEADWRAGKRPKIEKHLGAATAAERDEQLRALLRLEIELRVGQNETVGRESYEARFANEAAIVQSVFRDVTRAASQPSRASADTVASAE